MRQSLVPVLLLTTVALSSSSILLSINQQETKPLGSSSQYEDNIISNKQHSIHFLKNIFCRQIDSTSKNNRLSMLCKSLQLEGVNADYNENVYSLNDHVPNEDNYNGEGFRQEQWHNYPRQLDRLHRYIRGLIDADDNSDPDDPEGIEGFSKNAKEVNGITTSDFLFDANDGAQHVYDAVIAATNPLLILKIQLACLSNGIKKDDKPKYPIVPPGFFENNFNDEENKIIMNDINPDIDVVKVKRENTNENQEIQLTDDMDDNNKKSVKKRIFSLWSRLQSLSHKGHELHHRRRLHAYYGLPDAEKSGTLTAETRATFKRPPGSPLRWG